MLKGEGSRATVAFFKKREVVKSWLDMARTGCWHRQLPHEFPPWFVVWEHFRRGAEEGKWEQLHHEMGKDNPLWRCFSWDVELNPYSRETCIYIAMTALLLHTLHFDLSTHSQNDVLRL